MVILGMLPPDEAPFVVPIAKMDPRSRIKVSIPELTLKDDSGVIIPFVPYPVSCTPVVVLNLSKQPELELDPVARYFPPKTYLPPARTASFAVTSPLG